jgi:hypothetical protein
MKAFCVSAICEVLGHGSLRLDSEDTLYNFISEGAETNREMFSLLEFVRWEYCSTDVINDFFDLLSDHLYEMNVSVWAKLTGRLIPPQGTRMQFPPSVREGRLRYSDGSQTDETCDIPEGIIAHLTRECGGNVHDHHIIEVTSGSFEKQTYGANPFSGSCKNKTEYAAKNAVDLATISIFNSAYREKEEDIPHTRNNWLCYDYKERRIVPTHCTIRTNGDRAGSSHLKSWLVETSEDGESWREVAREEENNQLNGKRFTGTFAVAGGGECRFIRLVNIGRNHRGSDSLCICAWEIFGTLIE